MRAAQSPAGASDATVAAGDGTGSPVDSTDVATAVPTTIAGVNAAPPLETEASAEGDGADAGDDDMSSFDVMRELAEAGTDRGDPGLDSVWDGKTELTIMVLGVDRREDGGDQNADVIILVKLDLIAKSIQAVSIPRDLLVTIPNHGEAKINGAYNIGVQEHPDHPAAGVAMMRDTIEDNFGVIIDDYVLLDFQGFEAAIDAVGGVEVTVPYRIVDDAYPTDDYGTEVVTFEPGVQEMDGETALKYARTRNVDSDDGRRERQADILLALFDEAKDLGSITKANSIIIALGDSVQTSFPAGPAVDAGADRPRHGSQRHRSGSHSRRDVDRGLRRIRRLGLHRRHRLGRVVHPGRTRHFTDRISVGGVSCEPTTRHLAIEFLIREREAGGQATVAHCGFWEDAVASEANPPDL